MFRADAKEKTQDSRQFIPRDGFVVARRTKLKIFVEKTIFFTRQMLLKFLFT
jgi:hypothetical protein